jgi:hypothetical protein
MSDEPEISVTLEALASAGFAEAYLTEDGQESMRLTDEGAAMAEELGILKHGPGRDESGQGANVSPGSQAAPTEPLDMTNSWGSAVGAAMLGFEQALRSEPPPEILAGEHIPERGHSGTDDGIIIEFPDETRSWLTDSTANTDRPPLPHRSRGSILGRRISSGSG